MKPELYASIESAFHGWEALGAWLGCTVIENMMLHEAPPMFRNQVVQAARRERDLLSAE